LNITFAFNVKANTSFKSSFYETGPKDINYVFGNLEHLRIILQTLFCY